MIIGAIIGKKIRKLYYYKSITANVTQNKTPIFTYLTIFFVAKLEPLEAES